MLAPSLTATRPGPPGTKRAEKPTALPSCGDASSEKVTDSAITMREESWEDKHTTRGAAGIFTHPRALLTVPARGSVGSAR